MGGKNEMIKQAKPEQLEVIKFITQKTIKEIYPHYYPKGAVDFFLAHHNDIDISKDIASNQVFMVFDKEDAVGTVTIHKNEICRLFVLPKYQKRGFGSQLLNFSEDIILKQYDNIVLDASLPAKKIYLKKGYVIVETHSIQTHHNDYLCYDVMKKDVHK